MRPLASRAVTSGVGGASARFGATTVPVAGLALPNRGMRLQVHHWVGPGDGLCGSCHRSMETITVTPEQIIYHRRLAVLEHAARAGNVSEACRTFGVSRTRYYEWKKLADGYGTEALMPKARRRPQLPNATPTHVIEQLLTLAVLEPTLGARRLSDRLAEAGWPMAASTAQKYLHEAGLGTRRQPGRSSRPGGRGSRGHPHRGGTGSRADGVLPRGGRTRRADQPGQLLHRQPERRRGGCTSSPPWTSLPAGRWWPSSWAPPPGPTPPASWPMWSATGAATVTAPGR